MTKIIITGGSGDWASHFKENYGKKFDIENPGKAILDVTCQKSVEVYFESMQCDVLVNNAGTIHPKRILESDPNLWVRDINVNLVGAYLTTRAALAKNPLAKIINISSTAAFNAYPDWSSYCASKAAMVTFSKCLHNDGFDVYCLCPGAIDTKFRNYFSLSNDNTMSCDELSTQVIKVLESHYQSGDVIFFRRDELIVNP